MATTGVIIRRDHKSVLVSNPPRIGEVVFALDTEEFGTLQNGVLVWKTFTDRINTVAGRTGDVVLSKFDVSLGNVDNTSDMDKPISTALQAALDVINTRIDDINQRVTDIEDML